MATHVPPVQTTPSEQSPHVETVDSNTRKSAAVATTLGSALHEATSPKGRRPRGNAMYRAAQAEAASMDSAQRSQGAGITSMETTEKQVVAEEEVLKEIATESKNIPSGYSSSQKQMYMTKLGMQAQNAELHLKTEYNEISTAKSLQISPNSSDILTESAIGDELVRYNSVIGRTR
ncbi:MAG: hypothetical protein SP1CHLAM54_17690 [Chlamydiia bacterium]|nr:hypothetical protein [Chlamydiia bacterium]MCH9616657.1 hypothetical protein [Chlamydiia bacterium]MCH9629387.1 hypothetical protein [Chlamydiia bacterium]